MILIADSGATKTEWSCITDESGSLITFMSQGYNPNYISESDMVEDIKANIPAAFPCGSVNEIYFYGAGVTPLLYPLMERVLKAVFRAADTVFIAMDTLASCRALLQREPGFAAILGTGSNSCLYDGCDEYLNVDSCGFILGDEGSGAYLGKRLITDYIRHNMPADVYDLVGNALNMNNDELLDQIYTKPFPNRFCAQYAKFIYDNLDFSTYFTDLVTDSFRQFFLKIVTHYPDYTSYSFNAVGSVAFYFSHLLQPVVEEFGMKMGKVMKQPMEGLVKYHSTTPRNE